MNFHASFFFLFCRGKHKDHVWANMKTKGMQFVEQKVCWTHMHDDSCKMWCWNMITDKCRNDMFIMMLKRCLCGAWYGCIYGHEGPENHLSLLRIWGRNAPCVQLRRRYGSSDFPRQKTRPTYNACVTAWCRCACMKRKENNTKG